MGDDIDLLAELELADDPCPRGCGRTLEECEDDDQPCAGSPLVHELEAEVDGLRAELRLASQELKIHRAEMVVVEKAKAWRKGFPADEPYGLADPGDTALIAAVDALPAETWKPAQPWQTPGGLTPEDDPPQPIGDPREDDEECTYCGATWPCAPFIAFGNDGLHRRETSTRAESAAIASIRTGHTVGCLCQTCEHERGKPITHEERALLYTTAAGAGQAGEEVADRG